VHPFNGHTKKLTHVNYQAKSQLDLYHAIIIIHQLSFLGLTTIPAGMYKATLERMSVYYLSTWATSALFIAWWLYVWITAPTFGGNPATGCNDNTIYVVFFKNVRATTPWLRWLFVSTGSIVALALVLIPIVVWSMLVDAAADSVPDPPGFEYPRLTAVSTTPAPLEGEAEITAEHSVSLNRGTAATVPSTSSAPPALIRSRGVWDQDDFWGDVGYRRGGFNSPSRRSDATTRARIMLDASVQFPEKVQGADDQLGTATRGSRNIIARLLFVTYGTVMLELTIKRNDVAPGENVWSFGQIVAVVIAVGGINEVVHFFLGKEWRHETAEDEKIEGTRLYKRSRTKHCILIDPPMLEERSVPKATLREWKELRRTRRKKFATDQPADLEANRRSASTSTEDDKVATPKAENEGPRSDI
jgi:hypothetical protein